jgi:hypothetical protein
MTLKRAYHIAFTVHSSFLLLSLWGALFIQSDWAALLVLNMFWLTGENLNLIHDYRRLFPQ